MTTAELMPVGDNSVAYAASTSPKAPLVTATLSTGQKVNPSTTCSTGLETTRYGTRTTYMPGKLPL